MASRSPGPDQENLDRALVAGLLLDTMLDGPGPPGEFRSQPLAVKARLQRNLVAHLAGRVTLDHFRALVLNLDRWFPYYYPLISPALAGGGPASAASQAPWRSEAAPGASARALREEALKNWLGRRVQELLPHRPHRKLHPDKLREFLRRTQGRWFRVKDFQSHFQIDRKTAWEYLQKLLAAQLLGHNGERSAAVRYCLADRFLVVRAGALRQKAAAVRGDLPLALARAVADWLITTGGEAFWEEQWRGLHPGAQGRQILVRLEAAGVLRVVAQRGASRLLQLSRHWLQDDAGKKSGPG
jgi:hypothetical protein